MWINNYTVAGGMQAKGWRLLLRPAGVFGKP
jgi:hypothetical protein